jgi:hypothetical protein
MSGVDLTQAYKTEKWNSTFQYQICNILGRLSIIEELYKKANERENFMLSTAYSELIAYLLTTCCDKLGQTSEFIQYENWLASEKHKNQRKEALDKISALDIKDPIEISKKFLKHITNIMGPKILFIGFLKNGLSPKV